MLTLDLTVRSLLEQSVVKPFSYVPRPLQPLDIDIEITHSGVCASDIHQMKNGVPQALAGCRILIHRRLIPTSASLVSCGASCSEWKMTKYPIVPGHEIVGVIKAKGAQVPAEFKLGMRVGVGTIVGCCGTCYECKQVALLSSSHRF